MRNNFARVCACACLCLAAWSARADVKLPAVLSDQMVLQRDQPIRIWGWAEPGEAVSVVFRAAQKSTSADASGKWQVFLPPQKAGGPDELTISAKNRIVLQDVLVGEVWVASGQSNMEFRVNSLLDPAKVIAAANEPQIRLFKVPYRVAESPQDNTGGEWQPCSPASVPEFSAVAYFFGRSLQRHLKVPIGLIESSRGATPAEAWTPSEVLYRTPELHYYLNEWARLIAEYPEAKKNYDADLSHWIASGRPAASRPREPFGPGSFRIPSGLFNGMIAPLTPLTIRGVIWYQGENNANRGEAYLYRTLFPAMIEGWRAHWNLGSFPFLFVQLANYEGIGTGPGSQWPELREAQTMTLERLRHTGMAVTIDIGDAQNIHPKDKLDVGKRLAQTARAVAYGEHVVASGPLFRRATTETGALRVWFTSLGGGLRASDGKPLRGFTIAGKDRVFVEANAQIEGDSILVSNPGVGIPAAVRYAWANNPSCNLANAAGLPASPFRSDDWRNATMPEAAAPSITLNRPNFGKNGWKTTLDPNLPNVLILGDSISIGYTREVRYLLRGVANVARPVAADKDAPVNCTSTVEGLKHLSQWLGNQRWSVIHFNWGLHDLCYRNPESADLSHRDKIHGKLAVPPAEYRRNLEELTRRLKGTGACLIWGSTTVVPAGEVGRFQGDERKYNEIAAQVMAENGIPIDDLYATTAAFAPSLSLGPGNVHYTPEGYWILGQQVANSIRTALQTCAAKRPAQ